VALWGERSGVSVTSTETVAGPETPAHTDWLIARPWRLYVVIALYAFLLGKAHSQGIMMSAAASESLLMAFLVRFGVGLGQALGAALVILSVRSMRADGGGYARQTVLPLALVALYLSTLLGTVWGTFYTILHLAAQQLVIGFVWLASVNLAGRRKRPVLESFGRSYLCFYSAWTVSTLIGTLVQSSDALRATYTAVIVLILVALTALEFGPLFLGGGVSAEGEQADAQTAATSDGSLARQCALVMDAAGLTPRERDILPLLARGHSTAYIARTLSIGSETAKTHTRSIYQKTNVHSKEELIELVEGADAAADWSLDTAAK